MLPGVHVTTSMLWNCTSIIGVLDVLLCLLSRRIVKREDLQVMRSSLSLGGGIFFFVVWTSVLIWGWDWFYTYIFPSWARFTLPLLVGIGYTLLASGMGWLSLKLPGNPAITWCVLGGVEGLLSHLYAIYGLGAVSKPPIMQGTDPFAVLIFAVFEKAFYWSLILLACRIFSRQLSSKPV